MTSTPAIDLAPLLAALWPLYALMVLAAVVRAAPVLWRLYRHSNAGVPEVDRMPGREFEHYLGLMLRRLGYSVEVTRAVGDYGADLVVTKDGRRILVQAKRYSKGVGIKAIQEAAAGVAHWRCDSALVVTNRYFSKAAKELARSNRVELWDRDALASRILEARLGANAPDSAMAEQPRSVIDSQMTVRVAETAPPDATAPCERCGSVMALRTGPRGQFYGCSAFPKCRFTRAAGSRSTIP